MPETTYFKPFREVFDENNRQRFGNYSVGYSPDSSKQTVPADDQINEAQRGRQQSFQDAIDYWEQEKQRNKTDEKRERWSAIASAATDAISGIAGMIGVANGAVHPATLKGASETTNEEYQKRLQKYKEAIREGNAAKMKLYSQQIEDLKERVARARENAMQPYIDRIKKAEAGRAEALERAAVANQIYKDAMTNNVNARTAYQQTKTDLLPAETKSRIDKNNRTGRTSSGIGSSGQKPKKKAKSGIGNPERHY